MRNLRGVCDLSGLFVLNAGASARRSVLSPQCNATSEKIMLQFMYAISQLMHVNRGSFLKTNILSHQ
jgi:hypothetical protein